MTNEQNNDIVVSFDGVKMKDFRAYWQAVARSDWAGQDKFFSLVVKSWPYNLDPLDPDSFQELELGEYVSVQAAIRSKSVQSGIVLSQLAKGNVKSKRTS